MSIREKQLETELRKTRELESNLTYRVAIANKVLEQQTLRLIEDTPLTLTGYRILRVVSIFEEITVSELSRRILVDRALISRMVATLVEQGFVDFHADPTHKRKKLIHMTEDGATLIARLAPRFLERRAELEKAIGEEALRGFNAALETISASEMEFNE